MLRNISVTVGNHLFNYQVAAIIRDHDKVLVNRLADQDFWFLPGGRVQEGEATFEAVVREVREELFVTCMVTRPVFLHENFFLHNGRRFHEVCVYYDVELPADAVATLGDFSATDGGIYFSWVAVSQLGGIDLRPSFLGSRLQRSPATFEQVVSRE